MQEIAALEKELAAVDAQLAYAAGPKPHAVTALSSHAHTHSQSPSQVPSSHIHSPSQTVSEFGQVHSSSRSHDSSIADDVHITQQTRSISTETSHSQQSDSSSGRRTSPSSSGSMSSRSPSDRRTTGSTADVGSASTDSLAAAKAQLQQLQQNLAMKQREVRKYAFKTCFACCTAEIFGISLMDTEDVSAACASQGNGESGD